MTELLGFPRWKDNNLYLMNLSTSRQCPVGPPFLLGWFIPLIRVEINIQIMERYFRNFWSIFFIFSAICPNSFAAAQQESKSFKKSSLCSLWASRSAVHWMPTTSASVFKSPDNFSAQRFKFDWTGPNTSPHIEVCNVVFPGSVLVAFSLSNRSGQWIVAYS